MILWIIDQSNYLLQTTYESAQRVQTEGDLGDITSLEEIRSLENFFLRDTVVLDRRLESINNNNIHRIKNLYVKWDEGK